MESVITALQAQELDKQIQTEYGIPAVVLMENAGRSAAEFILEHFQGPWTILAGKGNNGGDALVVARHLWLRGEREITVLLANPELGELGSLHLSVLEKEGCGILTLEGGSVDSAIRAGQTLVDGLFGVGLRGAVRGRAVSLIDRINDSGKKVVSLDVPSGLSDSYVPGFPVVNAHVTVTFEAPKLCLYLPEARTHCGSIHTVSAGFPKRALSSLRTPYRAVSMGELSSLIPRHSPWAYKGTRGHAAVFASSQGFTGAGLLAAEAALRSGAGLVTLFVDPVVYPVLASQARSLMVRPLSPGIELQGSYGTFLAGPGWGRGEDRAELLRGLLSLGKPGVVDADGLHALRKLLDSGVGVDLRGWILTPHPGEFGVLTGCSREEYMRDPLPKAVSFASTHGCVLVLKGHVTYIVSPSGEVRIYDGCNSLLGTGGTGDVLAGIITGFLAQGVDPYGAATAGVLTLGACGEQGGKRKGYFLSQDLLPLVSEVVWNYAEKTGNIG